MLKNKIKMYAYDFDVEYCIIHTYIVYVYVYVHVYVYVWLHGCMYVCVYGCMYVCMYVCMYIVVVLVPDFRLPACRSACMSANILRFLVFLCVFKKANIQHLIFSFFTRFVCKVFQLNNH